MVKIEVTASGRSRFLWTPLYTIVISSPVGSVRYMNLPRRRAWQTMADLTAQMVIEQRPFETAGLTIIR